MVLMIVPTLFNTYLLQYYCHRYNMLVKLKNFIVDV